MFATQSLLFAWLALQVTLVCVFSFLVFSRYSGLLFNGLDGANMLTSVAFQFAWTMPAAGFFANPLQGLADIWFNFNAWISPGFVLPFIIFGEASVADPLFQVSVYVAHTLALFVAVLVTMRSLGMTWIVGYTGAWAAILLLLPVFGVPLVYPILQLQPNLALTIAEALLIVATISRLGRQHGRSALPNWRDAAAISVLLALSGHFLLTSPTAVALSLPFFLFMTAGLLLGAATRTELTIKILGTAFVAIVLLAAGFGEFLLGILSYTAAKFSTTEFQNSRMSWYFISILFHYQTHGPGGPILAALGIFGLAHASLGADRRLSWIARSGLALAGLSLIFGVATVYYDFWYGPSPIYLEAMLWPIYATFAARLVVSIIAACRGWILRRAGAAATGKGVEPITLVSLAAAPAAIIFASFPLTAPEVDRGYIYPPSRPAIVEMLKERIGLALGSPIRGSVAVFQFQAEKEAVSWFNLHGADDYRMRQTGNDFHTVGLWYFGIPTLIEYAPTLSPPLFRTATHLLARPEDRQLRSVLVLRHIDAGVLATLGVRYVITDAPTKEPLRLIHTEKINDSESLYLYEVPDAILGAASPIEYKIAQSFDAALDQLSDPLFDPHSTAIVMESDIQGIDLGGLSPAINVSVRLDRGGLDIEAASQGKSLLAIPVQFSHCLTFRPEQPQNSVAKLVRINALETGILFNDKLSGKLRYFTGPFDGAGCRMADAREFSRAIAK